MSLRTESGLFARLKNLDLQAKITLVLVGVVIPIFSVVTVIENQLLGPVLVEEMKQIGVGAAQSLATQISSQKLLPAAHLEPVADVLDRLIQQQIYYQPQIVRMDIWVVSPSTNLPRMIASNIDEDPNQVALASDIPEEITAIKREEDEGQSYWEIILPLRSRHIVIPRAHVKRYGAIRVQVTLKAVEAISGAFWRITATAAGCSVLILIGFLSFFLRRTITNDRLLRRTRDQNVLLAEQLHEAQRNLMNTEKLAVMGQLTASFAHEIGTPLNAMGGHLQLLADTAPEKIDQRVGIITGQLEKIEQIVKNFLQSTAKAPSQRQLVDLNLILDRTLQIVRPRVESIGVDALSDLDRAMGPVRVVPIEMEQIFLNLVNNALDSLRAKRRREASGHLQLKIQSESRNIDGESFAEISIRDTGLGIKKSDLAQIFKPFFSTKPQGEGTGLGLTICRELLGRYHGTIEIDSKDGAWTKVKVRLPYRTDA